MKSAILAAALIGVASMAAADESSVTVVSTATNGSGQFEVVSQKDGLFSLHLVSCLPMMAGLVDEAGTVADLEKSGTADMVEVVRGTVEHAIATNACAA